MQKVGRFTLITIFCGFFTLLFCGQKALESQADTSGFLLFQGKKQWDIGHFDSAYILFRKAQISASQAQNPTIHTEATYRAGLYLARQMRLREATATLDSAIAMGSRIDSLSPLLLFARRERAYVALNQGDISDAIYRYEKIYQDMEVLGQEVDSIRALIHESLGQAYFYQGNFEAGLQKSLEALARYQQLFPKKHVKIGICANTLGIMYMYLNRFEEAITHFELSQAIFAQHYPPSHPNILQIQTNIGVLYGELGLFWKALEAHQQVFEQKEKLEPRPYLNALLNLGATLMGVGDYQSALEHFDEAERYVKDYPEMANEQMAYIAQNRAAIYQQIGREEAALRQINQAIEQHKRKHGDTHPDLIAPYFTLGDLLLSKKHFEKAKTAFQQALRITKEKIENHSLQGGHALIYLGKTAREEGDFRQAKQYFEEAKAHYTSIQNRYELANTYTEMAVNWRLQGQQDSCMAMHQRAQKVLFQDSITDLRQYWYLHPVEAMTLEQGKSLRYFSDISFDAKKPGPDTSSLQAALSYFEKAIAVVDSQQRYYGSASSRQFRLQDQLSAYESAIEICQLLDSIYKDRTYHLYAFQLAEKSKAKGLKDHLRGVKALRFAGLPDSSLEQERYYRQRLTAINTALQDAETESTQTATLQKNKFELQAAYHAFLQKLEKQYPAYYALKFPQNPPETQEILDQLADHQAIYSYFWGKQHLYIFRSFRGKLRLYRQAIDLVKPGLDNWLAFISRPPQPDKDILPGLAGHSLTQLLLPARSDEMKQITILPDGMLGYLPFESLLKESRQDHAFRSWPFLGKDIAFNYLPSAELLVSQHHPLSSFSEYVGFAPDFSSGNPVATRNQTRPLLHNQEEVQTVAKLLKGEAYTGAKADEKKIKNLSSEAMLLHFATHALADENDLMRSRLFLKAHKDSTEDGMLHAYEVYGLQLNSPLCVLSACQTAKGPLLRGEGVLSLARAFQYSGCRRVLSTLWQTDDRAAGSISQDFFAALNENLPVEKALLLARQKWLKGADQTYAHPFYWAGYVLIGDGGNIPIKISSPWGFSSLALTLALTLTLTLALYWWRKGRVRVEE